MTTITKLHPFPGVSSETTGTTTDAYVAALTLPTLGYGSKVIVLKNTHATRSLTFKVDGYAYSGGIAVPILTATALAALDSYEMEISKQYAEVVVSVISTVAVTPATYTVDYSMRGGT